MDARILKRAGLPLGEGALRQGPHDLSARRSSSWIPVVFSIGELDRAMTNMEILVGDTANGKSLFGDNGNFRLVASRDKNGARSVRMVAKLEIVELRK